MFLRIDNWMFNKVFQPFVDWFDEKTGFGPLWLSGICGCLAAATVTVQQLFFPSNSWWWLIFVLILVISTVEGSYINFTKDRNTRSTPTLNGHRNNKVARFERLLFLIIGGFAIITIPLVEITQEILVRSFSLWTFTGFFYFMACERKPPAPPKEVPSLKTAQA